MRIKETIPIYTIGQQVTIINDLQQRDISGLDSGLDEIRMPLYQGRTVTISSRNASGSYNIIEDTGIYSWTPNMFKESYDFESVLLTPVPRYAEGQIVTIHNNLGLGRDFHDITINSNMMGRIGQTARIVRVIRSSPLTYKLHFLNDDQECPWSWTVNCFSQSYTTQDIVSEIDNELSKSKIKKEDFTIEDVKVGMYIFHDFYNSGNGKHILAIVTKVEETRISFKYVHKNELIDYHSDMNEEHIIRCLNDNGSTLNNCSLKIKYSGGRQYIVESMYIPDERDLKVIFNLSNERFFEEPLKEGMTPIPDLFKNSKFKLKKIDVYAGKLRYRDIYAFHIKDFLYVAIVSPGVYKTLKVDAVIKTNTVEIKDYKDILTKLSTTKIKSFEESTAIFGHKTRKEAMFNSFKKDSKTKNIFQIHNVIFNYEKQGKYYHVVEVNDGTLNLKFLLSDLELILPNVNNYVFPKERIIKTQTICKVTKDKLLPVSKGSKVTVVKMFNRHVPIKGTYDKNTVCVVVDSNNKQFECKVHQLKRV